MSLKVPARLSLVALVLFGVQGVTPSLAPSSVAAQDDEAVCDDWDIDNAFWEVHNRAPNGRGTEGECDPKRYGGQWSSYEELVEKVRAGGAGGTQAAPPTGPQAPPAGPQADPAAAPQAPAANLPPPAPPSYKDGECKDDRIRYWVITLLKRAPNGKAEDGECDPNKYGVGPQTNDQELEAKMRAAFQGVCGIDDLTKAFREEMGRAPNGMGWDGECNPERYGWWSDLKNLKIRIRTVADGGAILGAQSPYPYAHSTPRSDFHRRVFELVNEERKKAGLPALGYHHCLETLAQNHSESMAKNNFVAHLDPTNNTYPQDRADAYGWLGPTAENVAAGQTTPEDVVRSWMNSPGHRDNILSPNSKEMGVGYVSTPNHYWTQMFSTKWATNAKCG